MIFIKAPFHPVFEEKEKQNFLFICRDPKGAQKEGMNDFKNLVVAAVETVETMQNCRKACTTRLCMWYDIVKCHRKTKGKSKDKKWKTF